MSVSIASRQDLDRCGSLLTASTGCDPAIWLQPVAKLTPETVTEFLRQLVAEIPWGQNLLILNKISTPDVRLWCLRATASFGWSRNVLLNQIKAGAYERAVTEKKTPNHIHCGGKMVRRYTHG